AAFQRLGKKLKPRLLMVTCGVMLCGLAVLMVGNGVRSLQVLGALPLTVWGAFELPALGLYATREGLLAQAVVLIGLVISAPWQGESSAAAPRASPAAPCTPGALCVPASAELIGAGAEIAGAGAAGVVGCGAGAGFGERWASEGICPATSVVAGCEGLDAQAK